MGAKVTSTSAFGSGASCDGSVSSMPSGFMFFGNVSLVGFGSFFAMFPSDALGVSGIILKPQRMFEP